MAYNNNRIPDSIKRRLLDSCHRTCNDCRVQYRPMEIHHKDRDRMNNSDSNLVVLCRSCHRIRHGLTPVFLRLARKETERRKMERIVERNRIEHEGTKIIFPGNINEPLYREEPERYCSYGWEYIRYRNICIQRMVKDKKTFREIAELFEISRQRAYQLWQKNNGSKLLDS